MMPPKSPNCPKHRIIESPFEQGRRLITLALDLVNNHSLCYFKKHINSEWLSIARAILRIFSKVNCKLLESIKKHQKKVGTLSLIIIFIAPFL